MIYYRSDTLRGRLFIDFTCNKDSFSFYIHVENKNTLEKWKYTPFSRALGYTTIKDPTRQKAWIKQKGYNIDFSGPFRTFAANNKNYLITEDGRIMLIKEGSINEKGKIPDLEQKVLVFDKDRNKLLTIKKDLLNALKEPLSTEKISAMPGIPLTPLKVYPPPLLGSHLCLCRMLCRRACGLLTQRLYAGMPGLIRCSTLFKRWRPNTLVRSKCNLIQSINY